jgi:hypothetical protein
MGFITKKNFDLFLQIGVVPSLHPPLGFAAIESQSFNNAKFVICFSTLSLP